MHRVKGIPDNEAEDEVNEAKSIMFDISCNINDDMSMKHLSRKRRSSGANMLLQHVALLSRYVISLIEHFKKKGVTVKT